MPGIARQSLLAAKCETTAGTDASPSASSDAMKVYGLEVQPLGKSSTLDRSSARVAGHWSGEGGLGGIQAGTVKASFHLAPSGTAGTAPPHAPLLLACGLKQDVTAATNVVYKPASSIVLGAWSSTADKAGWCPVTLAAWQGDTSGGSTCRKYVLTGCAGSLRLSGAFGKPVTASVDLQGVYGGTTITTLPAGTFGTIDEPDTLKAQTWQVSADGGSTYHTPAVTSFDFSLGTKVVMKDRVNCTAGVTCADLVGRRPRLKMAVEEPRTLTAAAGFDWWTCWSAGTQLQMGTAITLGFGGGSTMQLAWPKVTLDSAPQRQDGDGVVMLSLSFSCDTTTAADGDDEFTLTYA